MSWDEVQRDWDVHKARICRRWSRLTGGDLRRISGRRDELAGLIMLYYGLSPPEIERQLDEFELGCATDSVAVRFGSQVEAVSGAEEGSRDVQ